jgi:hypothetical protein
MTKEKDFWKSRIKRWAALDQPSRISEGIFGLIMVLTFTCTISVSTAGRQEVKELLWAALGCNLAWGLVDAIMYLMGVLFDRAHGMNAIKQIKLSANITESRNRVRDNMNPLISDLMDEETIDQLSEKIKNLPVTSLKNTLVFKDFTSAVQIFLIVFLITFPVAIPFIFIRDVALAMRLSNAVALVLLFIGGFALARYAGLKPIITALAYTTIGAFMVVMAMALGG